MRIRKAYQGTVPENKILDTYSTSQTDTYSCNFTNAKTATVLYDHEGAVTRPNTYTLSDSISNYKCIEIIGMFYTGGNQSIKVPSDRTNFTISGVDFNASSETGSNIWYRLTKFSMSGTTITHVKSGYGRDGSFGVDNNNAFIIWYVLGYKEI